MTATQSDRPAAQQMDLVRIGVLGCGNWGPNHIRNFLALHQYGAEMVVAADPDPARRRNVASQHPSVEVVESPDEVIARSDIDAVVIATPVRLHYPLAKQALEAGKHVLIEKPITTKFEEATELARIARERNLVAMVGHTFEYSEPVNYIRHIVRDGQLGNLTHIRSARLNLGMYRNDIDVIWDLAPHDISILLHVLERFPRTVQATAKAQLHPSVKDVATITLDFGDQLMANIIVSWLDPQKVREMTFVGDRKMLIYNDVSANEKIKIFDKGIDGPRPYDSFEDFQYSYRYGDIVTPMLDLREPLFVECRHFIECCQLGKQPQSDAFAGAAVTAIIEAAQASSDQGGMPISVDVFDLEVPFADWGNHMASQSEQATGVELTPMIGTPDGDVSTQRKAMVIDPSEHARLFAANVLTSFEPSFDVVTVATVHEAEQWLEAFPPDLLIVSDALDPQAADDFVGKVLMGSRARSCRVVSVGPDTSGSRSSPRWRNASISDDAGLSEWLDTIRYVMTS